MTITEEVKHKKEDIAKAGAHECFVEALLNVEAAAWSSQTYSLDCKDSTGYCTNTG